METALEPLLEASKSTMIYPNCTEFEFMEDQYRKVSFLNNKNH